MLPDGTWFQSATAERNTTITAMNRMKPRQSRQTRAKRCRVASLSVWSVKGKHQAEEFPVQSIE